MNTRTAFALLLLLPLAASAQTQPPPASASDTSLHAYGDKDKTCLQWTDGCRTCTRRGGEDEQCSNIGPACQPAAISCSQRREAEKK